MSTESIIQAVALAQKVGHIFVATADARGLPHVAAAAAMKPVTANTVAVSAWFCPGTLTNLDQNRQVALIVWDEKTDFGFQLLGRVEHIDEKAVLNGYLAEKEGTTAMPQTERILEISVYKVLAFSHAPHSDEEQ